MKEYIANHLERAIPVGYSAADIRPILEDTLNYFMCEDEDYPTSLASTPTRGAETPTTRNPASTSSLK
jgi:hypothetical protein